MTDVFGCFHLRVGGEKISKSRNNFYTGDQLLDEKGYAADKFATTWLSSACRTNFGLRLRQARRPQQVPGGSMNAAFERPISAAIRSSVGGFQQGPAREGPARHLRIVQHYTRSMQRADYPNLLFEVENYAAPSQPVYSIQAHDDRYRRKAAKMHYTPRSTCSELMIMLTRSCPRPWTDYASPCACHRRALRR